VAALECDKHGLFGPNRWCPRCKTEEAEARVRAERDQLLEAIDAHRAEKAHGPTANMDLVDGRLYELADQIKSTSKVVSSGEDASKEPKTCGGSRLQELLEWVESMLASTRRVASETGDDDPRAVSRLAGIDAAYSYAAQRIHRLQANEEKGGEG
jgi:hypothetical protein